MFTYRRGILLVLSEVIFNAHKILSDVGSKEQSEVYYYKVDF